MTTTPTTTTDAPRTRAGHRPGPAALRDVVPVALSIAPLGLVIGATARHVPCRPWRTRPRPPGCSRERRTSRH